MSGDYPSVFAVLGLLPPVPCGYDKWSQGVRASDGRVIAKEKLLV
jgi:hypothetical protein